MFMCSCRHMKHAGKSHPGIKASGTRKLSNVTHAFKTGVLQALDLKFQLECLLVFFLLFLISRQILSSSRHLGHLIFRSQIMQAVKAKRDVKLLDNTIRCLLDARRAKHTCKSNAWELFMCVDWPQSPHCQLQLFHIMQHPEMP